MFLSKKYTCNNKHKSTGKFFFEIKDNGEQITHSLFYDHAIFPHSNIKNCAAFINKKTFMNDVNQSVNKYNISDVTISAKKDKFSGKMTYTDMEKNDICNNRSIRDKFTMRIAVNTNDPSKLTFYQSTIETPFRFKQHEHDINKFRECLSNSLKLVTN